MKKSTLSNGYTITRVATGRSNAYLIETPAENLLVDTSGKPARRRIRRNLKKTGITRLHRIILTHSHFDHCDNAAYLQTMFGCALIVEEHAREIGTSGKSPLPGGTLLFSKILVSLGKHLPSKFFSPVPYEADTWISGSLSLKKEGMDIELLATPGHSSDSLSVLVNREVSIVGDTLFGIIPGSVYPPFADNVSRMLESWNRLLKTGCRLFLPGHGSARTREELAQGYQKHIRKCKVKISID